jgi:hypothetical protein
VWLLQFIQKLRRKKSVCLSIVKDKFTEPIPLTQSGWKEFYGTPDKPTFSAYKFAGSNVVPLDKWITAEGDMVDGGGNYKAGFHIYEDEREIKKGMNKFRRVYYRNVQTRGTQDTMTIVVAREMFVPSNPDAWPPPQVKA